MAAVVLSMHMDMFLFGQDGGVLILIVSPSPSHSHMPLWRIRGLSSTLATWEAAGDGSEGLLKLASLPVVHEKMLP